MIVLRLELKIFLLISISFSTQVYAQIAGVSPTKINAINHTPIPKGTAEFEPNYGYTSFHEFWDNNGDLNNIFSTSDSIQVETSVSFRMAYAFTDNLEFGSFIANDFSNWSLKYKTFENENIGLGVIAGLNLPFGNIIKNKSEKQSDQIANYALGVVGSFQLSAQASIDFNLQRQDYFSSHQELPNHDWFYYLDYGHYVANDGIQLMSGLSYQISPFEEFKQTKLTYYPGVAFEMTDNFVVAINGAFDIAGRNTEKTNGIAIAWTMPL